MDCPKIHDSLANCDILNLKALEKEANQTIEFPQSAPIIGNAITLFTMLVLQEILNQQVINPIANFSNIIQLSGSIANLNSSIKTIQ